MNSPISDLTDKGFEQVEDVVKIVKRDVVKGIPQNIKQQIAGTKDEAKDNSSETKDEKEDKGGKKSGKISVDPVTGKPIPSKKVLSDLTKATAQLQTAKIKKVREELEKQRLKTSPKGAGEQGKEGTGPQIPEIPEEKKPKPEAVTNALRGSKETGEFKGLIGG